MSSKCWHSLRAPAPEPICRPEELPLSQGGAHGNICLIFYIPEQFSHLSQHSSFVTCHHQSHFAVCRSFLQIGELLNSDFSCWAEPQGSDLSLPQLHWISMGKWDGPGCCGNILLAGVNSYPNPLLLHISHCSHSNLVLTTWRWFRNFSPPSALFIMFLPTK